jgi:enterochelin esterase-like enzyme
MQTFEQNVRFSWRMLLKKPGFSAALLTLALGIGMNATSFSNVKVVSANVAAQMTAPVNDDRPKSPALRALLRDIPSHPLALEDFWQRVKAVGAPLVEPTPNRPDYSLVTFLFRADSGSRVRLRSSLNALLGNGIGRDFSALGELKLLPATDVHFITFEASNELRISYRYEVSGQTQPLLDPLNPNSYLKGTEFAESALALPKAPPQPWADWRETGKWEEHRIESQTLGSAQSIWIYTPSGYDPAAKQPYPALIGLNSLTFGKILPTARVVEYLVAQGRIRPTLIIAAPDLAEIGEQGSYDPAVKFLADELLPWVRERYRITRHASEVIVSGLSRRGMIAAYAALRRPDAFQRVLSLSGSYYWRPPGHPEFEWLPALYAREAPRPVRFYLAAGALETVASPTNAGHYLLATNRHMRDVLLAKGYTLKYVEFYGVHSTINWQDQLLPGLTYLLSAAQR